MRFLVIDDEKFVADSLAMILEGDGHEAVAVYDGGSALEKVKSFTPDCVISDVIMPGLNGIEVCSAIEEQYPKCQILLFSGQASISELIEKARGHEHAELQRDRTQHPHGRLGQIEKAQHHRDQEPG